MTALEAFHPIACRLLEIVQGNALDTYLKPNAGNCGNSMAGKRIARFPVRTGCGNVGTAIRGVTNPVFPSAISACRRVSTAET